MKTKVYQEIAKRVSAYKTCEETGNEEWHDKHHDEIQRIQDEILPSGSGIDSGCQIDVKRTDDSRLVIDSSYHCMDENGFYDGWIDFQVIVTPSLAFGANVVVKGYFSQRHGKHEQVRDYLQEVFDNVLNEVMEVKYEN